MKKIVICLMLVFALLMTSGCGGKKEEKKDTESGSVVEIQGESFELHSTEDLYDIHYKENYVDFHTDAIGNIRTMTYNKGDEFVFNIMVYYDENTSLEEAKAIIEVDYGAKEQARTVNGIDYIYYEYADANGYPIHHYMYVYGGHVYSIGIVLGNDPGNIEEVFMNNVRFGD